MSTSESIGSGAKFRAVLDQVNMVTSVNCTVLIQGETDTGKEQIYKENLALRDQGSRASTSEKIVGASNSLKTVLARICQGRAHRLYC